MKHPLNNGRLALERRDAFTGFSHYRNHGGSDLPRQANNQIPIPPRGITAVHLGIRYSLKSISQLAIRIQTPEPRRRIGSETFRS